MRGWIKQPFQEIRKRMIVDAIFILLIACCQVYSVYCAFCVRRFRSAAGGERGDSATPSSGVSILIPVRGVDESAYRNWTSLCEQDYVDYEVLFGVMDPDDPAMPVLNDIIAKFHADSLKCKARRIEIIICSRIIGENHKISNLIQLLASAHNEHIIFADSDIRVGPDYIQKVTAPLSDPGVGMVTCVYFDHTPQSMGAAIAAFGRALEFIPGVLIARKIDRGLKLAIGPTMATRKSVIAEFGGLEMVRDQIASDYHIGKLTSEAGYKVELSSYILDNDCGREGVVDVFHRELRWARTIRVARGVQYHGMVFRFGALYSVFLLLFSGLEVWAFILCLETFILKYIQASVIFRNLRAQKLYRWLWALPIREALSFSVWLGGSFGRKIYWRGRKMKISANGTLIEQ